MRHVTEYSPAKTGKYPCDIIQFSKPKCLRIMNTKPPLGRKYAGIFVFGRYLFLEAWKTVRFSEQIISADKYRSIFPPQMEPIVYISVMYELR